MKKSTKSRLVLLHSKLGKSVEFVARTRESDENNGVRRALLGSPISAAISAPKGKRLGAFGESLGNVVKKVGHDGLIGAGIGGAAGLALGGAGARAATAGSGALTGALVGAGVGTVRGHFGKDADKINNKYERMRRMSAKLDAKVKEFAAPEEEEGHGLRNAALLAGGTAAAYGGAALYKGRQWQSKAGVTPGGGLKGLLASAKLGHEGMKYRAGSAIGRLRGMFAR